MRGKENVTKGILDLCKGKEILFIENDFGLYNSVGNFELFCIENKLQYHTILDLERIPLESIMEQIKMHDIIVWESTYGSDISSKLQDLMHSKAIHSKKLIECYISDPHWYYLPEGINHDLHILSSYGGEDGLGGMDEWEFYQLKEDRKPIWEKRDDEL